MVLGNVNYLAIVGAAAASFIFGGIWYGALARHWMDATGQTAENLRKDSIGLYLVTFAAQLIMAAMLAGALVHLQRGGVPQTLTSAMTTAAFVWFGFVVTTMTVNYAFHGARTKLTLIDGAHWLFVLLIQAGVLAWWP